VSRDAGEFQSLRPYSAPADPRDKRLGDRVQARVEAGTPDLRPRSVGELLDLAFEVLRSRFGTYVGVSAALWVPVRIAQPFIGLHNWTQPGDPTFLFGAALGVLFTFLSTAMITVLEVSLVSLLVAAKLEGRTLSLPEAFRRALSRFFSVALIAFVSAILTTLGFACICVLSLPGLYLTWKLYLAPAVCVIENAGVGESLSRSFELSRGRFPAWFALALVAYLFALPFASLTGFADNPNLRAAAIDQLGVSSTIFDWAIVVCSSLFNGVVTAVRGVVVAIWYFDCRARREGIDLMAQLARMRTGISVRPGGVS
jgi:hypothetical protein